jgi:hypothetical protein
VFASQVLAIAKREPAPALRSLLGAVRHLVPPVDGVRPVAAEIAPLIALFASAALGEDVLSTR